MDKQTGLTSFPTAPKGWWYAAASQKISFGNSMASALDAAIEMVSANRITFVTTNSLLGDKGLAEKVRGVLGSRCVSVVSGVRSHSPREDVIEIVNALSGSDVVVTIGGGSVCDAVKAARLCHANEIADVAAMDRIVRGSPHNTGLIKSPRAMPFIAIPTTLSAGEYTPFAGITNVERTRKDTFAHPDTAPDIVILDPEMTLHTPPRLWAATGLRAIDHAVETWCSTNPTPFSDATSAHATKLLFRGLEASHKDGEDRGARLVCLKGAWLSIVGGAGGATAGASHGIGHALGGVTGMAHGETSCVMLSHILRYNASANSNRQAELSASIGHPGRSLAELVHGLVSELGLPTRLRESGVRLEDLPAVAAAAAKSTLLAANPRPITEAQEVELILRGAW